jgi:hypothetical protein
MAVGGISFAAESNPFTFTALPGNVIEIQNRGITNNSAAVQTFIGTVDDEGQFRHDCWSHKYRHACPAAAIVTINGNHFQASYSGDDGNDLTLTVTP